MPSKKRVFKPSKYFIDDGLNIVLVEIEAFSKFTQDTFVYCQKVYTDGTRGHCTRRLMHQRVGTNKVLYFKYNAKMIYVSSLISISKLDKN